MLFSIDAMLYYVSNKSHVQRVGMGSYCLMDSEFWEDEKVLEMVVIAA